MQSNDSQLIAIEKRCQDATPGPWFHRRNGFVETEGPEKRVVAVMCSARHEDPEPLPIDANAEFIAQARIDLPLMVDEVRRLRVALAAIAAGEVEFPHEFAENVLARGRRPVDDEAVTVR